METKQLGIGEDPSFPGKPLYQYALASMEELDLALETAQKAFSSWSESSLKERSRLLMQVANGFRNKRAELIGTMIKDTGKVITEADSEVSEAIDFIEYYLRSCQEWHQLEEISWQPKGVVLVAPPWNFPCSIPTGGVAAALAAGNSVILKPAPEAILVAWQLAEIFWEAGISKEVLQLLICEDDPIGSRLIQSPSISLVALTGATATAQHFLKLRPTLDLLAETGGKNIMVITALADRDLAIKDLIHSAFSHAGQKCSACSLAILEKELYDDPSFLLQLRNAAASLTAGSPWNLKTKIGPLIRPPNPSLLRGFTQLEKGESWLLEPQGDFKQLWTPAIKLGVKPNSFTFQNELFGPLLGLVRASSFEEALTLMNQTPDGLTAGIHSLDEREQQTWLEKVEVGNCYINRTMTGAVVQRQPFGGCKESSFGRGVKAGGPNYITAFMSPITHSLPQDCAKLNQEVTHLSDQIASHSLLSDQEWRVWQASIKSYAFYWNHYFSQAHDPSLIRGQDNFLVYRPHFKMILRIQEGDTLLDLLRVIAATLICSTPLEISGSKSSPFTDFLEKWEKRKSLYFNENEKEFLARLTDFFPPRIRLLNEGSPFLRQGLAQTHCRLNVGFPVSNGRLELLHYLREVSISKEIHRYGNLGDRENMS